MKFQNSLKNLETTLTYPGRDSNTTDELDTLLDLTENMLHQKNEMLISLITTRHKIKEHSLRRLSDIRLRINNLILQGQNNGNYSLFPKLHNNQLEQMLVQLERDKALEERESWKDISTLMLQLIDVSGRLLKEKAKRRILNNS